MKRIAILVFPGFQVFDLAATTVFEVANIATGKQLYEVTLLSEHGGAVMSSSGVPVATQAFASEDYDTLLVAGGMALIRSTPRFLEFLRAASAVSRRTASLCTGAFVLAETGLLEGRRVTTHWWQARELQRLYPKLRVEEDRIFIKDGKFWSSAGMTACIDLCLAQPEVSGQG